MVYRSHNLQKQPKVLQFYTWPLTKPHTWYMSLLYMIGIGNKHTFKSAPVGRACGVAADEE